jgi:outer membrane biosynthesis protein TonB
MTLRIVAVAAACIGLLCANLAWADGMPDPDDEGYNPVPSKPGVPAPGVTQPPPVKPVKTTPPPAPAPTSETNAVDDSQKAPVAAPPAPEPESVKEPEPAKEAEPVKAPPVSEPAPPSTPVSAPSTAAEMKTVYEVISVDVKVVGDGVTVTVKGSTRTGGWKNIELRPLQTFAPEAGMRSFTLVGTPPGGMSTQAITPVTAVTTIAPLPADVKTIRVLAETNEVAQTFR